MLLSKKKCWIWRTFNILKYFFSFLKSRQHFHCHDVQLGFTVLEEDNLVQFWLRLEKLVCFAYHLCCFTGIWCFKSAVECWKIHLFLGSHKPLRSWRERLLCLSYFLLWNQRCSFKSETLQSCKNWKQYEQASFCSFFDGIGQGVLLLQYSGADLHVHDSFGRSFQTPHETVGRQKPALSTCFFGLSEWYPLFFFFLYTRIWRYFVLRTLWLQILGTTELCVEQPHHPPTQAILCLRMRCWTCRTIHLHVRWLDVVWKLLRTACSIHEENQMGSVAFQGNFTLKITTLVHSSSFIHLTSAFWKKC